MTDDWSLKGKRCDVEIDHSECYNTEVGCCDPALFDEFKENGQYVRWWDIDDLRQRLIEEIDNMREDLFSGRNWKLIMRQKINRRFGVE